MISTVQKIIPANARLVGLFLVSLFWLIRFPALAVEQSDRFATENKTADKTGQVEKKDTDDPFAPAKLTEGAPAAPIRKDQGIAKATSKGKPTSIDDRIDF